MLRCLHPFEIAAAQHADILFLKHACSTLRQSCGFSMMEQVRLRAVWPMENWLASPMNHMSHCLRMLLSCFRKRTSDIKSEKPGWYGVRFSSAVTFARSCETWVTIRTTIIYAKHAYSDHREACASFEIQDESPELSCNCNFEVRTDLVRLQNSSFQ